MTQFTEGLTKRMPDYKVGKLVIPHTFFDEGYGSCQTLSAPLSDIGALKVTVSTYSLSDKAVKNILKSLVAT